MAIDSYLITFITMVSCIISMVCILFCLCLIQMIKSNLYNIGINIEMRTSQLLNAVELKANAEGQMQGRDWAQQQNSLVAAKVITNAENAPAQLLTTVTTTQTSIE